MCKRTSDNATVAAITPIKTYGAAFIGCWPATGFSLIDSAGILTLAFTDEVAVFAVPCFEVLTYDSFFARLGHSSGSCPQHKPFPKTSSLLLTLSACGGIIAHVGSGCISIGP